MKHRVTLAREQGVDADAAFCRQLFEAAPLQFVSDEYFTLLAGQFSERIFQFIKEHVAEVERFRAGIGRWQQIFDLQQFAAFALDLQGQAGILVDPEQAAAVARFQAMLLRSPATRVEGGTDEILRNIIAERVLGLPADIRVDKDVPFNQIPTSGRA